MTTPASPTEIHIQAAQELELEDEVLGGVSEILQTASTVDSPHRTPSKVEAAAARLETPGGPSDSHEKTATRPSMSSSSSFRSIPASSSIMGSGASPALGLQNQPANGTFTKKHGTSSDQEGSSTPTPKNNLNRESFAEIALSDVPIDAQISTGGPESYHMSPVPVTTSFLQSPQETVDASYSRADQGGKSFLSSAFGVGNSIPGQQASHQLPSPALKQTASGTPVGSSGWRSTMSNLLGNRSGSSTPAMALSSISATTQQVDGDSTSASFILQQMASPRASRDRRVSREIGATDKLREGFERVRLEMEGAAREMRREAATGSDPGTPDFSTGVDWVFWGAVVQDYEKVALERPKILSRAIQQGIPDVIRGAIWQLMSSSKSASLEETYKALLKVPSSHDKAIAKDLSRTFPSHKFFQEGIGSGQESLFMVVKAYSLYDQEVGYTQGLAFIVAALLLNMPDEEAFCVLVRLMESYNLRSHFLADMPGLQLRLFQFDRLVEDILPLVHTHFVKKGIKSSMYASQWFMTLFSYRFPLSLVYRVLDIVFAEGIEAIFRFSLALLSKSEDKLVNLNFEQILSFLQADLFEVYRAPGTGNDDESAVSGNEEEWRANDFVRDAYEVRITPFMLDSYASEYEEQRREHNRHAIELDQLRNANRSLSAQVKQLEASLVTINTEHVTLVRQLVMSRIEKEEIENELVRYKMMYAELAHSQQDALSTHSRFSAGSSMSQIS